MKQMMNGTEEENENGLVADADTVEMTTRETKIWEQHHRNEKFYRCIVG